MPRPPLAQPLFFFSLLLVVGGAAGAVGSFWWTARWHDRNEPAGAVAAETVAVETAALPLVEDSEWANRPGWRWVIEPVVVDAGPWPTVGTPAGVVGFFRGEEGIDVFLFRNEDPAPPAAPGYRFEAVALDASGNRVASVETTGTASSAGATVRIFRLPSAVTPPESVRRVGVEVMRADSRGAGSS